MQCEDAQWKDGGRTRNGRRRGGHWRGGGRGYVGGRTRWSRDAVWEEEEGCTVGGACGALGGELGVEMELELRRRGGGFGFAPEEVYRATNRSDSSSRITA